MQLISASLVGSCMNSDALRPIYTNIIEYWKTTRMKMYEAPLFPGWLDGSEACRRKVKWIFRIFRFSRYFSGSLPARRQMVKGVFISVLYSGNMLLWTEFRKIRRGRKQNLQYVCHSFDELPWAAMPARNFSGSQVVGDGVDERSDVNLRRRYRHLVHQKS